jgi:hypothetical protein
MDPNFGNLMVCVRFLRTQQRVKSQCIFYATYLVKRVTPWIGVVVMFPGRVLLGVLLGLWHSTESLILAQDERWRRA